VRKDVANMHQEYQKTNEGMATWYNGFLTKYM
jgi:hypothetical protein